ncbi:methionine synthase [Dehalococcoidia bacterium]|nr:methionine synthase [Dehalococcoidia bacterium]
MTVEHSRYLLWNSLTGEGAKRTDKTFKPGGLPTAIGSMPHTDPAEACSVVLAHLPDIPVWPQLPLRSFLESMYTQFSEGFPGLIQESDRIYVDRSVDLSDPLGRLYAAYMDNDLQQYAISPEYAAGFHRFLSRELGSALAVKGQVTGPISFGLMVTDQDRRPILYDDTLADALAKHLALKARWQERELSRLSPNTIVFLDEPYLASTGSAFVAVSADMVVGLIDETLSGLRGLKGIHCCGNADWPVLMNTTIDILSFDAYNYGESLTLYPAEIKAFLDRGGVLSWGIVPSDEAMLSGETASKLLGHLEKLMGLLSDNGIDYDRLLEQSLITPSCGLASISPRSAERALELTAEVSREFRRSQGGERGERLQ